MTVVTTVVFLTWYLMQGISASSKCLTGWVENGDSCYLFVQQKANWPEAKANCSAISGYLAEVDDARENNFLIQNFKRLNGNLHNITYWLGGTDEPSHGEWHWDNSGKAFTFTYWGYNQPSNDYGFEHCLHARSSHGYTWNDVNCDRLHYYYVCEMKIPTYYLYIPDVGVIG